jgi:hypothetical protein
MAAHLIALILPNAHFTPARLSSPFRPDHEALSSIQQHNAMVTAARRAHTAVLHSTPIHHITQTPQMLRLLEMPCSALISSAKRS